MADDTPPLIDPALLEKLTPEEQQEALAAAEAAKRAEERAELLQKKKQERARLLQKTQAIISRNTDNTNANNDSDRIQFMTQKQREEWKEKQKLEKEKLKKVQVVNHQPKEKKRVVPSFPPPSKTNNDGSNNAANNKKRKKIGRQKMYKFEWDAEEDTTDTTSFDIAPSLAHKHQASSSSDKLQNYKDVWTKPLSAMTDRDWRIFRENYDIRVKGGRAPPPLRKFRESTIENVPIHPRIIESIEKVMRFKDPSPIQRQAIPIGLQRRDLIGIAETGSGKTVAFGVPLCHYILSLPPDILRRVARDGPLALVMAPTRELAIQIELELSKLISLQHDIHTLAIVGGQAIQVQASKLRQGVHIIVGTPGRLNDCIEMAYLVLNQCSYVVLDEADRMIDMGFAPQIDTILDSMGGLLKSEEEELAYQQEEDDLRAITGYQGVPRHRLTAMFSATMPPEVERIAKKYLRHPAYVHVGDEDSGKNARIEQRILFLSSPAQKEKALVDTLSQCRPDDRIIVFVNEKKHTDGVARMIERTRRRCVVLHGGKTQDQREENLEVFKRGGAILVATDVAGRGLDIPNVTHVINYDLPTRSIENYTHRIGRTGRAGKTGLATSFLTNEDESIMGPLKRYLESTGMPVPDRLRRAADSSGGAGGDRKGDMSHIIH